MVEGRIDITQLKEKALEYYQKTSEPIDINNPVYQDFIVLVPKSLGALERFCDRYYPIKHRRMTYPDGKRLKEMEQEVYEYFHEAYMDEIFRYDLDLFSLSIQKTSCISYSSGIESAICY